MSLLIENIGSLLCFTNERLVSEHDDAVVLIEDQHIKWVGPRAQMPAVKCDQRLDAERKVVMPGLIDCHTHLMFAGTRADEFARRMNNESYETIMAKGGGIMSTVSKTRDASDEELLKACSRARERNSSQWCYHD